jgi:biotin carboxyl carrier protein
MLHCNKKYFFKKEFLTYLDEYFVEFLNTNKDSLDSAEFFLPSVVTGLIKSNNVNVEVINTDAVWYGMTYKEDKEVVKASEAGTVLAIKNDPRYGLTVIIEHDGGFKTVYSNLLTAEFVVEGEKVKKGQTLGTIGNSASFEISDKSHLHFEILKDSEYVDPSIYLK